jgi:[acyl-carrier-protein] S-malonyltransferase
MGKSLFDGYPSVKRLFQEASDLLRKDFAQLCFEGPETTLVQTDNVQPAMTLVNLACAQVLAEHGIQPAMAAGHSLGEYSALCAAGVLSFADTMRLVDIRGAVMKQAAERHPGGMTALVGLDIETVTAMCQETGGDGSVEIANHNSAKQVVLTGEQSALEKASVLAKAKGARLVVPLNVSGAWHSRLMTEAVEPLRAALAQCAMKSPSLPVVSNVTADVYPADPDKIREILVRQVVSPVQWAGTIRRFIQDGYNAFIEVGPGKVLSGLMRDVGRSVKVSNVQDVDSLQKFLSVRVATPS